MKTTKALFFELMYDFQSERWKAVYRIIVFCRIVAARGRIHTNTSLIVLISPWLA
jgi:hypothetical protein